MRLFPETQVLKDLFDDIRLVDEANDAHFPLALGTGKRIDLIVEQKSDEKNHRGKDYDQRQGDDLLG